MVPTLILLISTVALCRLAISYWRAILLGMASEPISEEIRTAAQVEGDRVSGQDFRALAGLYSFTLEGAGGLGLVGLYYRISAGIGYLGSRMPAITKWAEDETTLCAQYMAVQLQRRLRASLALSESMGSY
jgi:hypothetical protein